MAEKTLHRMTPRPGTVIVPSQTHLGVNYEVTVGGLTCNCPHNELSRRAGRHQCKHVAVAITENGMVPLPDGRWVHISRITVADE